MRHRWIASGRATAGALIAMALNSGAWGDEPDGDPKALTEKENAERRMKFMLHALEKYEVVYPGDPPQISRLHAKPLLRWTNPVTTIKDGTLAVARMWASSSKVTMTSRQAMNSRRFDLTECNCGATNGSLPL